jgi:elongation factor 1-alpha
LALQSAELGKPSFKYAWVVNKTREERERGITIRMYNNRLETDKHIFNMITVPGHQFFIKTTIRGIGLADTALLVVAGNPG